MRDYGDNIGGIKKAWIWPAKTTVILPKLEDIGQAITQTTLDQMEELPLFPHQSGYRFLSELTDQGTSFDRSFTAFMPSDNASIRVLLEKYQGQETQLILLDHDDRLIILFDQDYPGMMTVDFAGGTEATEGKVHTLTIRGRGALARRITQITT